MDSGLSGQEWGCRTPEGRIVQGARAVCEVRDHLGRGRLATLRISQASSRVGSWEVPSDGVGRL